MFRIHEFSLISVLVIYASILSGCSEGFKSPKKLQLTQNGGSTGGTTGGSSGGTTGSTGGDTGGTTTGDASGWGVNCRDTDAINLNADVYNSPTDISGWSQTTRITRLDVRSGGIYLEFDKKDGPNRWPDYFPPGWDEPIQYTLWLMMCKNGRWHAAGLMQYWYGLDVQGGDITENNNQIAINWVYDGRWGELEGHQPAVGERIAFFVSAGNARGPGEVTSVRERSNVVVLPMPASAGPVFNY